MRIEIITGRFEALQDVDDPADILLRMLARSTRANGRALRYVSAEEQTIFNDKQLVLQRYKSSSGGTWLTDEAFQEPYF